MAYCIGCGMDMGEAFRSQCVPGCGEDDEDICPYCGDEPKADDEEKCETCLMFDREREQENLEYEREQQRLKQG